MHESAEGAWLDASASYDPDGDVLAFEWLVGGDVVSEESRFALAPDQASVPPTLRVTDDIGHTTWVHPAVADGG